MPSVLTAPPSTDAGEVILRPFSRDPEHVEFVLNKVLDSEFAADDAYRNITPEAYGRIAKAPSTLWFDIIDEDSGDFLGFGGCNNAVQGRSADYELNIWDPRGRGRHRDQKVSYPIMVACFLHYDLRRMTGMIAAPNSRARNYARRLGWVEEGRMNQAMKIREKWYDAIVCGILREELKGFT